MCFSVFKRTWCLRYVHAFLPVYAKVPMFMQWENIALYTESKEGKKKYLEESLKICFPKSTYCP